MTQQEQSLADDKMRAEIAKLIAETRKISAETFWYPILIATGLVAAIGTATGVVLKLLGL